MNDNSPSQFDISAGGMFLGYLVACGTGSIALFLLHGFTTNNSKPIGMEELLGMIGAIGIVFILACITALPGFVMTRLILRLFRRTDWPSFAAAGALNAVLVVVLFFGSGEITMAHFLENPPSAVVPFCGGLAGAAACLTERYFARRAEMKAGGT